MEQPTANAGAAPAVPYEDAVRELLERTRDNAWFVDTFWPENQRRARTMVEVVSERFRPGRGRRVLDVGCFNGFLTFLLGRVGYEVTAVDSYTADDQRALVAAGSGVFRVVNLDDPGSFADLPAESFDAIVVGEVFEHVFNDPLGLLKALRRLLRVGGVLVLDTPNPATVANAVRLLRNRYTMHGTRHFLMEPKVQDGVLRFHANIHYREYLSGELAEVVAAAGLHVERHEFFAMGSPKAEPLAKRVLKTTPLVARLFRTRLFGSQQLVVAVRR